MAKSDQVKAEGQLRFFEFGEAPAAAALGYSMRETACGTKEEIARVFSGDLIAVQGAMLYGRPGVYEWAIMARMANKQEVSMEQQETTQPQVGQRFKSTDPTFEGTVIVTAISGDMVHYTGDADGCATITQFLHDYQPAVDYSQEDSQGAKAYRVHLYAVVRVPVAVPSATSQLDAIDKAQATTDLFHAFRGGEYAEDIVNVLVEEVGDDEDANTCEYEGDPETGKWAPIHDPGAHGKIQPNGKVRLPDGKEVDLLAIQAALNAAFQDTGDAQYGEAANQLSLVTQQHQGPYGEFLPGSYISAEL